MSNVTDYLKTRNYTLIFDYGILIFITATTIATIAAFKTVLNNMGILPAIPSLVAVLTNIACFLFCLALRSGSPIKLLLVTSSLFNLFLFV
jgi:hypothetical protein